MRDIFDAELHQLGEDLAAMSGRVEHAITNAGIALLTADLALAESVIADDLAIDAIERDLDERCVLLLAQQQPVATDLRIVVSALRMSASLERMGDLARHVAQVARGRYPRHAVPQALSGTFAEMHDAAVRVARRTTTLLNSREIAARREHRAGRRPPRRAARGHVRRAARRLLGRHHAGDHRRHAARPVLRAVRRPRRLGRPPRRRTW